MLQLNEEAKPKIEPTRERIQEIAHELMNLKNAVSRRLRNFNLYDSHDQEDKRRYQPREVATIVALAESDMKIRNKAIEDHEAARNYLKNQKSKLQRQIKKIEKTNNQKFNDLPPDVRKSSFYGNSKITGSYHEAFVEKVLAQDKKERLIKSKTRPEEKHLNAFCINIKKIFLDRGHKSPDYKLIRDIVNLFSLSNSKQTYDSIRKRFSRLSK